MCEPYLRMHGMLRRAQAQCAFTQFNPEIVDTARQCYERIGSELGAEAIRAGAGEFDQLASVRGQAATCSLIERQFPMVIR
ncbi:hypothetical protein [Methylobacterium flocculans]|uniref:hypothetical protein n=1 Tax=Methylobacterium flocculans TaxID=2984843 RepID=UPI0021F26BD3|nr:hypothetical protein [Methylobacterium sp. FF17]